MVNPRLRRFASIASSSLAASARCSLHCALRRAIFSAKGSAVVGLRLGADVASGGEHVAVLAHLLEGRALAEPGDIGVLAPFLLAAPGVVGVGDALDVVVAQLAVRAVDHVPQIARVDEEHLVAAVVATAVAVLGEEPETGGYLGRVEGLWGQRHHAVDEAGLDQVLADLALPRLVRRHRAVGKHEAGHPVGREVVRHVLHPGEVGVTRRRDAVGPALVVGEELALPLGVVEVGIGEDEVGLQVGVAPWGGETSCGPPILMMQTS